MEGVALDVSQVLLGSFQAVVLVVFLVQTLIEAVPALQGRFTPVVALVVGLGVAAAVQFAPAQIQDTLGTGLALAAAASMTVRYVKRGELQVPPTADSSSASHQQAAVSASPNHQPNSQAIDLGVVDFGGRG